MVPGRSDRIEGGLTMDGVIGLVIGFFIGGSAGVFFTALIVAASCGEED